MTKIEETRREMYRLLEFLKRNRTGVVLMREFEQALEDHLEETRKYYSGVLGLSALKEQQNHDLRVKLDKKNGRISQLTAWMKSAVRDNKRLRADRKAFIQTQDEQVLEIQRLTKIVDGDSAACDGATGGEKAKHVPMTREELRKALRIGMASLSDPIDLQSDLSLKFLGIDWGRHVSDFSIFRCSCGYSFKISKQGYVANCGACGKMQRVP